MGTENGPVCARKSMWPSKSSFNCNQCEHLKEKRNNNINDFLRYKLDHPTRGYSRLLSFLINCAWNLGSKGLDENASKTLIPQTERKESITRVTIKMTGAGTMEYAGKPYDMPYTRNDLALVVQKLDSAIHRINHDSLDSAFGFPYTYPLDNDLSSGWRYSTFKQLGPIV